MTWFSFLLGAWVGAAVMVLVQCMLMSSARREEREQRPHA